MWIVAYWNIYTYIHTYKCVYIFFIYVYIIGNIDELKKTKTKSRVQTLGVEIESLVYDLLGLWPKEYYLISLNLFSHLKMGIIQPYGLFWRLTITLMKHLALSRYMIPGCLQEIGSRTPADTKICEYSSPLYKILCLHITCSNPPRYFI